MLAEINELYLIRKPKSGVSEAIRTLRTNLQFASVDKKYQTYLITSSQPSEGKSFISANLAVAFAQIDNKVLVIDCDMRKGRAHEIFGLEKENGLSNLLIDDIKNIKKYIKKTEIDNVSILTMGSTPPNPAELLESDKMKELIKELKKTYDIIIFDAPPVLGLTDSLILSCLVDSTILVATVKKTPIDLLDKAKKAILNVNGNISGVVMNKVTSSNNDYYYTKYYTN